MIATAAGAPLDEMPRFMTNVSDVELDTIRGLMQVWRAKYPRNLLRGTYYDAKMPFKPSSNIPAQAYSRMKAVLGWPAKAVLGLALRTVFDGFVAPGADQDPFELQELLDDNRFDIELPQAIVSAFKHSCAFITTTVGDVQSGEPEVVIQARAAEWSSAIWDKRRRRTGSALAVTDVDQDGRPKAMDVYLADVVLRCSRRNSGAWIAERLPNPLGEVLVEPLTYDPQLDRPFGRSRITRPLMTTTDNAIRTLLRAEVGADFYAAPRMWALNVTESAFERGKWNAAVDRWFAITSDESNPEAKPQVGQFPQMTMQPLGDLYRLYASIVSGETGLPVSSLGIVQDNPPSAEAIYAGEKDLIVDAKTTNRGLGASLRQVARKAVLLREGSSATPEVRKELTKVRANWLNPAFTSPISAAQALQALAVVFPWLGETEVALEYAGFTQPEITRLLSDKRRSQGGSALDRALAARREAMSPAAPPAVADPAPSAVQATAADLKASFDALGVAVRAGVDPADAATRLGLGGIAFTGAVPVSLRPPDAGGLEKK